MTINIDRNWLDLGTGSVGPRKTPLCGGVRLNYFVYQALAPGANRPRKTAALQCLLSEQGLTTASSPERTTPPRSPRSNQWQTRAGANVSSTWSAANWSTLLSAGATPVLKIGSASQAVRRLQRALNAAMPTARLHTSGLFDAATSSALRTWQRRAGIVVSGVAAPKTWAGLQR